MSGWGDAEFQAALGTASTAASIALRYTWIQFPTERARVAQYYLKSNDEVKCCIVPDGVVRLVGQPYESVVTRRDEYIMVWPDRHADYYNARDDTFARPLGQLEFADSVWGELFPHADPDPVSSQPPSLAPPLPPATVDDIFADLHGLLKNLPDTPQNNAVRASIDTKKEWFLEFCDPKEPGDYKYNANTAYGLVIEFIERIDTDLHDQATRDNAAYISRFCHLMCSDISSFGTGHTIPGRIEARLQTYYTDPECPQPLRIAKLSRQYGP